MKELFVSYELALKLKEKGFNEPCFGVYMGKKLEICTYTFSDRNINSSFSKDVQLCSAPLYQQVVDWFREKHNLHVVIHVNQFGYGYMFAIIDCEKCRSIKNLIGGPNQKWTYYDALTKAIEETLKLI